MNDLEEEIDENICMRISKGVGGKPLKEFEPDLHKGLFGTSSNQ
jgi:hypothetical protein